MNTPCPHPHLCEGSRSHRPDSGEAKKCIEKGRSAGASSSRSLVTMGAPASAVVMPISHPEPVEVLDASGDSIEVTPGVIDDEATYVYTNGQCLALAESISKAHGWPVLVVTHPEGDQDDEGESYDRDAFVHVYAITPEGDYLDIAAAHDPEGARESHLDVYPDASFREVSAADVANGVLRREFEGYLEEQSYEVAAEFVDVVTEHRIVSA